jgi:predicted Zn-dependent protease
MGKKTQRPIIQISKNIVLNHFLAALILIISTGLLVIFFHLQLSPTFANSPPSAKTHPLPPTLAKWQDKTNSGDYFNQIAPIKLGYLVWSKFPIKVYIETPKAINNNQTEAWVKTVSSSVQEWNPYLPLEIVQQPEVADITIIRKAPPLQGNPPRARSAQTNYDLSIKNNILYHHFNIMLSPSQTGEYLSAAVRHEFGHALGIWGHSPLQSDALYFSQVRQPPPISARDVNTLKRIYEQPTSLGWEMGS